MPAIRTLSYNASQLLLRITNLSIDHRIRTKYFAYFLDISESNLYSMLEGRPSAPISEEWVQQAHSRLDQITPLLEEYDKFRRSKVRSNFTAEATFNRWLITQILRYRAEPPHQPPAPPPLHAKVANLLGSLSHGSPPRPR